MDMLTKIRELSIVEDIEVSVKGTIDTINHAQVDFLEYEIRQN